MSRRCSAPPRAPPRRSAGTAAKAATTAGRRAPPPTASARPWLRSSRPRAWMLRSTPSRERARALAVEADDLVGELRRYGEAVDAPPGRLDEVEERLALFDRLKRKHGGTIEAVMAHAEECRRRRTSSPAPKRRSRPGRRAGTGPRPARRPGRRVAGGTPRGCRRPRRHVPERLAGLAMEGATFEARLAEREGYGPTGGDEVEFLIAPTRCACRPAARDRLGRRALARHARAAWGSLPEAGPGVRSSSTRSMPASAGDRARRRRAAAGPRCRPPDHLHHPPAADRVARRPPLHDRQGQPGTRRARA